MYQETSGALSPDVLQLNVQEEARLDLDAQRHARLRVRTRLKLLAGLVVLWAVVWLFVYIPARGNGSDFQDFYVAAYADAHGIDVFNWPALWQAEQVVYNGGIGHSTPFAFVPYGNPPPFALLVRPFTALTEQQAYPLWAALIALSTACGAYLGLAGWPRRQRVTAAVAVTLCPAALFNVRLGQLLSLLLLGLGLALWLLAQRRPGWAGAALTLGLVKPHLMIPVAILLIWARPPEERRRLAVGALGGTVVWVAIALLADGGMGVFGRWWASIHNYLGSIRLQPDVASLPGLYYGGAPEGIIGTLNALCLVMALAVSIVLARGTRDGGQRARERLFGGGLAAYFALSPYVHTGDQVLLVLPLLWLIGPQGRGLRDNAVFLAAMAAILAPMVVFRDYHTRGINALPPLCLLLAYAIGAPRAARRRSALLPVSDCTPSAVGSARDG